MKDLMVGQTIYWNDPDKGKCTGFYRIEDNDSSFYERNAVNNAGNRLIVIRNQTGTKKVWTDELEPVNYEQAEPKYTLQDKNFYLRFAEIFNTRKCKNTKTCTARIHEYYERLTNFRWNFAPHYSEFYSDFFTEFHNAVNEAGLRLRTPLPTPEIQTRPLAIYPHKAPKLRCKGALSLKYLIPKDCYKNYLFHGIGIINEWAYATDGRCLAKIKDDRWTAFSGRIAPYYNFEMKLTETPIKPYFLEGTIDYEAVLPQRTDQTLVWPWNIHELNNLMYSASCAGRNLEDNSCSIGLTFDEHTPTIYLDPKYFSILLRILCANGAQTVDLEYRSSMHPLLLRADNGNVGLVAPFTHSPKWIISTFRKIQPV